MGLEAIVTSLINYDDDAISRYRRALKLFEFEASLFDGTAFKRLIAGKNSNRLRRARILATIKILQRFEEDFKQARGCRRALDS